tara:strand:+ start:8985 stop:9713 length:729 start_codon:yes stop_codon:yes gene_type:complete
MKIMVENEFDKCVVESRGILISDLVGKNPAFNNADYLFDDFQVIAELKCLEKDRKNSTSMIQQVSKIIGTARKAGKINFLPIEKREISSSDLPFEIHCEIMELYRKPIQAVVKQANKQIKQTKIHLKRPDYIGLLILVNDGHSALSPSSIWDILGVTFSRNRYSSIDSVLFFTVNPMSSHPEIERDLWVWCTTDRSESIKCPKTLLRNLEVKWFKHLENLTNQKIPAIEVKNVEYMNKVKNV